jgi:putative intracellular protease/amidase
MSLKDPNIVNPKKTKRVAIVISNPGVSTTTGWPVGFWWSELSHPYFFLTEKGYAVDVFSPNGGKCEADAMSDPRDPSGYSDSDIISLGFLSSPKLAALIENTRKVSAIDVAAYDAIVVAGGQGPMFTFEKATDLHRKFVEFYEAGKIACAALCAAEQRSISGERQGRHRLCQCRGRLCGQRGLGDETAVTRQARDALARRGRAEKAWRQFYASRAVARLRHSRR